MRFGLTKALLIVAFAAGCDAQQPPASAEPSSSVGATVVTSAPQKAASPGAASGAKRFGEQISVAAETKLADIAQDPSRFSEQTVRTTGVVQAVCQKAGCWMEISDESSRAHIKMQGHSFYIPRDAAGKKAVVQAVVKGAPTPSCGDHADSCAGEANGATAKIELVASGVELVD